MNHYSAEVKDYFEIKMSKYLKNINFFIFILCFAE